MKVVTIDSEAYKMPVKKIDCIYQYLKNQTVPVDDSTQNPNGVWIDNDDATALLEVSPRTLQCLRSNGQITYSVKKHKAYYALSEIRMLIHGHIVSANPIIILNKISHDRQRINGIYAKLV
ncbi:MAG: DNA-binding protein [Prevotella sp.]|jgi:hypothetical protein|nr:DNA-binding protein [Prevotella sp.]